MRIPDDKLFHYLESVNCSYTTECITASFARDRAATRRFAVKLIVSLIVIAYARRDYVEEEKCRNRGIIVISRRVNYPIQ